MTLLLEIILVTGRYDAGGGQDPKQGEWPPHPARVFSALRSVADDTADLETLRQLERLPSPTVFASPAAIESLRSGYVVTNRVERTGGNLTYPGRNSGLRERRTTAPASPRVLLAWDDGLPESDVALLDAMAARVPYLGRSTSVALMQARWVGETPPAPDGLVAFTPCSSAEADTWLRTPYPGYTDELDDLFVAGLPAWQASDGGRAMQPYRIDERRLSGAPRGSADDQQITTPSPYRDLVVLRFAGLRPEGRLTNLFTAALRSCVMQHTADPLPPALHGHDFNGRPHVAYLGLPVVGHQHADGHLVALGVAIPGLDTAQRRAIMRGVLGSGESSEVLLDVPRIGQVTLRHEPGVRRPRAALAETWSREATSWVSVTPIVLDRYPKSGDIEAEVRRSCELAGLPEPLTVATSPQPMTPGAIRLSPRELPRRAQGRLFCHARLTFAHPVSGPVLVGAGRYFGIGFFAPESPQPEGADR